MDQKELREKLKTLAEPEYQRFSSRLLPNVPAGKILGVRLLKLRKLAKEIAGNHAEEYLEAVFQQSPELFEEIMIQGMVIGYLKGPPETIFPWIRKFLPKINNWSVCDSFCSGLKIAGKYKQEMWEFLQPCFVSDEEYTIRFGVVMLLMYYAEEAYLEESLKILSEIRHPAYYVKMAVAWALSIFYIRFPKEVLALLWQKSLEEDTYRMTLQKIVESRKVPADEKEQIRQMRTKK